MLRRELELLEGARVNRLAGLERVRLDVLDGEFDEAAFSLCLLASRPKQRLETTAEAASSCGGFRHAGTSGGGSGGIGGSCSIAGRLGEGGAACSTRRINSWATAK